MPQANTGQNDSGSIWGSDLLNTVETNANIQLYNPDGATAIDYEVCELFYDAGTLGAATGQAAAGRLGLGGRHLDEPLFDFGLPELVAFGRPQPGEVADGQGDAQGADIAV